MCLAIPMKIETMNPDQSCVASAAGVEREVNLMLLEDPRPGEYVIVHAGFAIEKLDEDEAMARLELFEQIAEAQAS